MSAEEGDHAQAGPPPAPAGAESLCGDPFPTLTTYASLLADDGVTRGLIGAREVGRLWERHLLNCAVVAPLLPRDATVVDLGSGAGLPGIVLAAVRPDVAVTLVEPMLRRTTFLEEVVTATGLANATVLRGRAEEFHGKRSFDVVTSRALAPLDRLLAWSLPLMRPTGTVLALKGARVTDELAAATPVCDRWGCTEPEIRQLGGDALATPTTVAVVAWKNPGRVTDPPRTPGPARSGGSAGRGRKRRGPRGRGGRTGPSHRD